MTTRPQNGSDVSTRGPLILQLDEEEEAPVQVATLISGTAITDAALEPARALMAARRRGE
ncbi:MAG: hypothetical protein GVY35_00250 [Bacteroidetes bacterium]|nr:hypothetical protein [Bacteroidota bacterium]